MHNASGHQTFSDKIGATYDRMKAADQDRADAAGETYTITYIGASGATRQTPPMSLRRADALVARFLAHDKFPGIDFSFRRNA